MLDLPADSDGLRWIVSHNPSQLLLIPRVYPASVTAAAAGDHQTLACLRITAQQHAALPEAGIVTPLDKVCLEFSKLSSRADVDKLYADLEQRDPSLAGIFRTRQAFTRSLLETAAKEGQLAAMKWMRAICSRTFALATTSIICEAARQGHLEIVKYICSELRPGHVWRPPDVVILKEAAEHQDCIKWLLANHKSRGIYDLDHCILVSVAHKHGLSCLKWCRDQCELPHGLWNQDLFIEAAASADQPMLEWLRGLDPPVPWTSAVCGAAARHGSISTLAWLRNQEPPCPWGTTVTAAAAEAANGIGTLEWLRAQDPPCPWDSTSCIWAANSGTLDSLIWLREQMPPCPWDERTADCAAHKPTMEILKWLHQHGCPFGPRITLTAAQRGNLPMLQWLHLQSYPLHRDCPWQAVYWDDLAMLVWLGEQGCPLTSDLYVGAARYRQSGMLRYLHSRRVRAPGREAWGLELDSSLPHLMFLADIGTELPEREKELVVQARKASCTFHGLVQWCRQAVSDPSRGAHRGFDSMAENTSGQVLLCRLSLLPKELLNKIAVAAELQHDILSP